MNTQINRVELLKKLVMAKPAVSAQSYIPILSHFLFTGDAVTAYNDINAITVLCDTGMQCCLPAELLIKTLSSIASEMVTLFKADNHVLLSAGRSKIKLPMLPVEDFPYTKKKSSKVLGSFNMTNTMLKGLKKCLIGVGNDTAHPAAMGVTLDPFYSPTQAAFYSTDNVTLSRFVFNTDDEQHDPIIIPTFFCNQLLSLAESDKNIHVEIYTGSLLAIFGDGTLLFTKTLADLQPMDFPSVIGRYLSADGCKTFDIPDVFEQAIERALLIQAAESFKNTTATVANRKLLLESVSKFGEARDEMSYNGEDVNFRIDPSRVKRISQAVSKMALLPNVMLFTSDDESYIHLVAHCSN